MNLPQFSSHLFLKHTPLLKLNHQICQMDAARISQFSHLPIPNLSIIDVNESLVFIGSCFAQEMSNKLHQTQYPAFMAPFGTIFNPVSLNNLLLSLFSETVNLDFYDSNYFSWDYGHLLKNTNAQELLENIQQLKANFITKIQNAKHAFISFGSAWVYEKKGIIIANCHKLPQNNFNKRLLTAAEVTNAITQINANLKRINPNIDITYTLSPVKHLKDGIVENVLSKSILHAAILLNKDTQNYIYFPSYEIVTEELRDYRYYSSDLAHPSEWTTAYIFKRFIQAYFTPKNIAFQNTLSALQRLKNHKTENKVDLEIKIKELEEKIKENFSVTLV